MSSDVLEQHIHTLSRTLERHKYLFDSGSAPYVNRSPVIKNTIQLYVPKGFDMNSGVLINGGGYLRFNETLDISDDKRLRRKAYDYSFTCDSLKYQCSDGVAEKILFFHFRFDKDQVHEIEHLQVLHDVPRYPSANNFSLEIMLNLIEQTFFNQKTRHSTPPWDSR